MEGGYIVDAATDIPTCVYMCIYIWKRYSCFILVFYQKNDMGGKKKCYSIEEFSGTNRWKWELFRCLIPQFNLLLPSPRFSRSSGWLSTHGEEEGEGFEGFQKIGSSSHGSTTVKFPKMGVIRGTGYDIGWKSSLSGCNHAQWFECLIEASGVTPPHSSVRWAAHQSGHQAGIFFGPHDASAQGPPSRAAKDENAERLTTLSVNQDPTQLALSSNKEPSKSSLCPRYHCQRWRPHGPPQTTRHRWGNGLKEKTSMVRLQTRRNALSWTSVPGRGGHGTDMNTLLIQRQLFWTSPICSDLLMS